MKVVQQIRTVQDFSTVGHVDECATADPGMKFRLNVDCSGKAWEKCHFVRWLLCCFRLRTIPVCHFASSAETVRRPLDITHCEDSGYVETVMAVPKRKISKSRSRSRRAQWNLKAPQLGKCQNCGSRIPTHVVCPQCGHYMGRPMVVVED